MSDILSSLVATQAVPNSLPGAAFVDFDLDFDDDDELGDDDDDLLFGDDFDDDDDFGDDDFDDDDDFGDDDFDDEEFGGKRSRYARLATRYTRSMQKGKENRAARLMSRMQKIWGKMKPIYKSGLDSPQVVASKAARATSSMTSQPAAVQQAYYTSNYARRVAEGRQAPRRRRFSTSDFSRLSSPQLRRIQSNTRQPSSRRQAAGQELQRRGGGQRRRGMSRQQQRGGRPMAQRGGRPMAQQRRRGGRGRQRMVRGRGYPSRYTATSSMFGAEGDTSFWSKTVGTQPFMSILVAAGIFTAGAYYGRERLKNLL